MRQFKEPPIWCIRTAKSLLFSTHIIILPFLVSLSLLHWDPDLQTHLPPPTPLTPFNRIHSDHQQMFRLWFILNSYVFQLENHLRSRHLKRIEVLVLHFVQEQEFIYFQSLVGQNNYLGHANFQT